MLVHVVCGWSSTQNLRVVVMAPEQAIRANIERLNGAVGRDALREGDLQAPPRLAVLAPRFEFLRRDAIHREEERRRQVVLPSPELKVGTHAGRHPTARIVRREEADTMSATRKGVSFWQAAIVPFEIDPNFDRPDDVRDAIHQVEAATNLRFVRRSRQDHFLRFVNGQMCQSAVGAQGKPNQRSPASPTAMSVCSCTKSDTRSGSRMSTSGRTATRSWRFTRRIIKAGEEDQFEKRNDDLPLSDYDPSSLMHYPPQNFSANGKDTITPLDASIVLGNSTFSAPDVAALNELYPNVGIVRRGDSGVDAAKRVSEIAVASDTTTPTRLVTAVRTKEGNPRLILWEVNAQGGVKRKSDSAAAKIGEATSISIARGIRFVTAVRTKEGRLKLISWDVDDDKIGRLKEAEEKRAASLIRLLALTDTLLVTAFRRGDGGLTLITWRLESDGRLEKRSTEEATVGLVSEISLTRVRVINNQHFVAATVATPSRMLTVVFRISVERRDPAAGRQQDRAEGRHPHRDGHPSADGAAPRVVLHDVRQPESRFALRVIGRILDPQSWGQHEPGRQHLPERLDGPARRHAQRGARRGRSHQADSLERPRRRADHAPGRQHPRPDR